MFKTLRAIADVGRTQGITTTASIAIVGALTSTATLNWYHIIYFTIIAGIAHMTLNTYIALGDTELDAKTYNPSRNPILTCSISPQTAKRFIITGTIILIVLIAPLFYFYDTLSIIIAFLCFLISYIGLLWYGWKGKKYLLSYDFSFSLSYIFFILFGVYAVGGTPTTYTWFFASVVFFAATAFAQWENGFKDVDADRTAHVKSFAVITGVHNNERLSYTHPYFIYGCVLKAGFIICCMLASLFYNNIYFLLFVVIYGIPSQTFILYRFATKTKPIEHRKTILFDVPLTAILGYMIIVEKTGLFVIFLLILYLISGYLIGSFIQSDCEFKFKRFTKKIQTGE